VYYKKDIPILSHQWYRINKYSSIAFMMVFRILTDADVNDPFHTCHSFTSVVAQTQFRKELEQELDLGTNWKL